MSTCQMEVGGEHSDREYGIPLRAKALGSWDTVNGLLGPKPSGGEAKGKPEPDGGRKAWCKC